MDDQMVTDDERARQKNFNVLFCGQIQRGLDRAAVRRRIAEVFKLAPDRLERLFGAEACYLKRNIDYATAVKIQTLVESAGAEAVIQLAETVFTLAPAGADVLANRIDAEEAPQLDSPISSQLDAQPTGSYLLPAEERVCVESVEIDTSHLTLQDPK
jgi:hypothetical protein